MRVIPPQDTKSTNQYMKFHSPADHVYKDALLTDQQQCDKMLANIDRSKPHCNRDIAIITLMCGHALAPVEFPLLRWKHFSQGNDGNPSKLNVPQSTRGQRQSKPCERIIALTPDQESSLKKIMPKRPRKSDVMFPHYGQRGQPDYTQAISQKSITRIFNELRNLVEGNTRSFQEIRGSKLYIEAVLKPNANSFRETTGLRANSDFHRYKAGMPDLDDDDEDDVDDL